MRPHSHPPRFRLLDAALAAAGRGWPVFPLYPRSRHPAVKRWAEHATTDPAILTALWQQLPYNVGIACGPARLVVIDLDDAAGHGATTPDGPTRGAEVFAQLCTQAGQPVPRDTYTVHTPSGGQHLYFQAPPGIHLRNTAGRHGKGLGPLIDVRGGGGLIIAAGSVRPDGIYRADTNCPRDPALLPDWLIALLTPPAPPPRTMSTRNPTPHHAHAYAQGAVRKRVKEVKAAGVGTRHHTLLSAAGSLGRFVGQGHLDYSEAWTQLYQAASVHIGQRSFTETEAETTIRDGLAFGIDHA